MRRRTEKSACQRRQIETARHIATEQSRLTHAAPEALSGCHELVDILVPLLHGKPFEVDPALAARTRNEVKSSGYVRHTLDAACWSVANTSSFADAVLLAVNLGDDADTVGAVTGQIAGALYGLDAIPPHWADRLFRSADIRNLAEALIAPREPVERVHEEFN